MSHGPFPAPTSTAPRFAVDQVITQPGALTNLHCLQPQRSCLRPQQRAYRDGYALSHPGLGPNHALDRKYRDHHRRPAGHHAVVCNLGAAQKIHFSTANNQGTPAFYWTRRRHSVLHKTNRVELCKNVNSAALAAMKKDRAAIYSTAYRSRQRRPRRSAVAHSAITASSAVRTGRHQFLDFGLLSVTSRAALPHRNARTAARHIRSRVP